LALLLAWPHPGHMQASILQTPSLSFTTCSISSFVWRAGHMTWQELCARPVTLMPVFCHLVHRPSQCGELALFLLGWPHAGHMTWQELCAKPRGVTGPHAPMHIAMAMARHGVLLAPGKYVSYL
jgi:hypothetical protein